MSSEILKLYEMLLPPHKKMVDDLILLCLERFPAVHETEKVAN